MGKQHQASKTPTDAGFECVMIYVSLSGASIERTTMSISHIEHSPDGASHRTVDILRKRSKSL